MILDKFYASIRPHVSLTTQNVQGFDRVLAYAEKQKTQVNKLAYLLATAWWETNKQMWPIVEAYWLSEDWRKRNLRYYPWHGRGLIQVTWKENYIKVAKMLGLPEDTFTNDPDKMLDWEYALPALFYGAETGIYTGKSLSDYIDDKDESDTEDRREYVNARRVVNGTDKAATIADLALKFEQALHFAEYGQEPAPKPEPPRTDQVKQYELIGARAAINAAGMSVVWDQMKEI